MGHRWRSPCKICISLSLSLSDASSLSLSLSLFVCVQSFICWSLSLPVSDLPLRTAEVHEAEHQGRHSPARNLKFRMERVHWKAASCYPLLQLFSCKASRIQKHCRRKSAKQKQVKTNSFALALSANSQSQHKRPKAPNRTSCLPGDCSRWHSLSVGLPATAF